ncbi:hypothetical protein ASE08_03930 [Rhizobacter sp. Root16D2]|nr:hypothetical protein ASC88_21955 [Rhizobacter sp. Root29]KQW10980.1 hypothetical protein ASC98_03245 [Rhizobacter sp. Root1238]KRB25326.1 hypothetical protein ASE08_03930 [Rhizobacter sp. Root16D2]
MTPPVTVSHELTGLAAAGAPLADAVVTLKDAEGRGLVVTAAADGSFRFADVGTYKAPFLLTAKGTLGGASVELHAPVLVGETNGAHVNVTPLTELITALALGTAPGETFDPALLTAPKLQSAQASVQALLRAVLDAMGVASTVDLRTAVFAADHSGLDRALDAIRIERSAAGYTVTSVVGDSSTDLDPAAPQAATPLAFDGGSATQLGTALNALPAIRTRLQALTALFKATTPAAADLKALFTADFLHTGLDADDFAAFLRKPLYVNASFDNPRILSVIDDSNVVVGYRVHFDAATKERPITETLRMQKVAGAWQFKGDGELAALSLSFESRLVATPLAQEALLALPRVRAQSTVDGSGAPRTLYWRDVLDAAGEVVDTLYLGAPGDYGFGYVGYSSGDSYTPDGLVKYRQNTEYYATPNSAIEQYFIPAILSDRVSPHVASALLTGPGLPGGGLTLTAPTAERPRWAWIFKGDSDAWTAFNASRCRAVNNAANPVPDCGFDLSKVQTGSEYVFSFRDAGGNVLGEMRRRLPAKPADATQLLADKGRFFARLQLDASQKFSVANLYDENGAFKDGAMLVLHWSFPTAPKMSLHGVGFSTFYSDAAFNFHEVSRFDSYLDSDRQSLPLTVTRGLHFNGAYANIEVYDHFGNTYKHEVNDHNIE